MADYRYVTYGQALALAAAAKEKYTNQDAIGVVTVNGTSFTASEAVDELKLIDGENVTLAISGDTVTVAATDTTYDPAVASVSGQGGTDGLLSAVDKEKLDGIEDGAEVNQYAFGSVKIGADTVGAAAKQDVVEFEAGTNVSIAVSGKKLTFAATDTTYSDVVADATGQADSGLMTSSDKAKLDGIEAGAQANVIEGVKVNGTSLVPENKIVDVTVTTGDSGVGTFKANGQQVTVHGLGTAAAADVSQNGVAEGENGLVTGDQVNTAIKSATTAAYHASGSIAASGLASELLVAANEGNVYNLSDALTVTSANKSLFVEGVEASYPAGTNVVVVKDGNAYKFDVLPGFVDLSGYVRSDDLGGLTQEELEAVIAAL